MTETRRDETLPQNSEILRQIEEVASQHLTWDGHIAPDDDLVEKLALDSLRLLTLIVEIENHFRVCLDTDADAGLVTAKDLASAIRRKLEEQAHHPANHAANHTD